MVLLLVRPSKILLLVSDLYLKLWLGYRVFAFVGLEGSKIQSITKNFTEKTHLLGCSDGLKVGALRSWASFVGMEAEARGCGACS